MGSGDTCIVDQDRRRADVFADSCGGLGDGGRGRDVAFVVADRII
jgi:hypothetical protein